MERFTSVALPAGWQAGPGGDFYTSSNTNQVGLARLNADGSLDSSFNPGSGANAAVFAVAVQASGKMWWAAVFTTINQTNRNRYARLRADARWTRLLIRASAPMAPSIRCWSFPTPISSLAATSLWSTVCHGNRVARINGR